MEGRKQSLKAWLGQVLNQDIPDILSLANGDAFGKLMKCSKDFQPIENNDTEGWKGNFRKLKSIFKQLQNYYKSINTSFPSSVSVINLVDIAKCQDQQGLINMLILLFIACIESTQKQKFITAIISLEEEKQKQLMDLIQQCKLVKNDVSIQTQDQKSRQKINQLCYYLGTLELENQSLNQALLQQSQKQCKLTQTINKLQQQNIKIKKLLNEKIQQIRQKQQQVLHVSTSQVMNQVNNQVIQQLKKTLYQQQQQYSKEIITLKQKIDTLQQELTQLKRINEDSVGQIRYNQVDHTNCINIVQHKQILSGLSAKITQFTKNQWKSKTEIIKLKNSLESLKSQKNKLQLTAKSNQIYVDKNSADKIKMDILIGVKDLLAERVNQSKKNRILAEKSKKQIKNQEKINQEKLNLILSDSANQGELPLTSSINPQQIDDKTIKKMNNFQDTQK